MISIGYYRPQAATDYVAKFVNGRRIADGQGRSFFYGPRTTLVRIPSSQQPIDFLFRELTADTQTLVVQGTLQVSFVAAQLLSRYDFTIKPKSDGYADPQALERLANEIKFTLQKCIRQKVQAQTLEEHMRNLTGLEAGVTTAVAAQKEAFTQLGVAVTELFITGIAPGNKDLERALEAKKREELLSGADKAQAERHKAAAASSRELREYEAATELAMEQQRAWLVKAQNDNLLKEAAAQAEAETKRLEPFRTFDPGQLLGVAMQAFAKNGNIGQLNLTSDLLAAMRGSTAGGLDPREV